MLMFFMFPQYQKNYVANYSSIIKRPFGQLFAVICSAFNSIVDLFWSFNSLLLQSGPNWAGRIPSPIWSGQSLMSISQSIIIIYSNNFVISHRIFRYSVEIQPFHLTLHSSQILKSSWSRQMQTFFQSVMLKIIKKFPLL